MSRINHIDIVFNLCFVTLALCSVFCYSERMTDTHILSKWLFSLGVFGFIGIFYGITQFCRHNKTLNIEFCYATILTIALLQSFYALLQNIGVCDSYFTTHKMVGSYDNPAGLAACLCLGIAPCVYFFRKTRNRLFCGILVTVIIILFGTMILSGSRAGVLGAIIVFVVYAWRYIIKRRILKIATIVATIFLLFGMYFVKKDSADGRLLIMCCCWDMIKERPLLGHGLGAMEAHYMDYQAAYFASHPDSHYVDLADNVKHPFNEFLKIVVELGTVGFLYLLLFILAVWKCYRRTPSWQREVAILSLLSIAVMACFSYPLTYPFVWLVILFDLWVLLQPSLPTLSRGIKSCIMLVIILLSCLLLYRVGHRLTAEYEWWNVVNHTSRSDKEKFFACYESLMPKLGNEPYFLYNYAAELYVNGDYERALHIAEKCRKHWADYDLELIQGECCAQLGRDDEAVIHFTRASQMCPVRFMPLYRLYKLYQKSGCNEKARTLGLIILDKAVKIESSTIEMIKEDIRNNLESEK